MAHSLVVRGVVCALLLPCLVAAGAAMILAQEPGSDLEELKRQMQEVLRRNAEQQKQIDQLQRQLESMSAPPAAVPAAAAIPTPAAPASAASELDKALEEAGVAAPPAAAAAPSAPGPALFARRVGGAELKLIDISFDILTAAGTSTEGGDSLRELQGGAHDPNRRGFTLQQGEFSLNGAVDPYFTAEAHIVFTPDGVELEEAFGQTTSLPYGLQAEAGYFLTEFGRLNPTHPHAWRWIDQPVVNTRMFGGDGLRAPGFRIGWLTPLPWYSQIDVGIQDGDEGGTTLSFLNDEGIGGRPAVDTDVRVLRDLLYLARWANSWDVADGVTALLGVSGLFGRNATGRDAQTYIYGTDATFKWRPANNFRGWPFLEWQTEAMKRDYTASRFTAGTELGGTFPQNLPSEILRDWGLYSQVLWGFHYQWAGGVRFDYASGHGQSVADGVPVSRSQDAFRDDRYRLSPLLIYDPSEFSRIRLQYNYDYAKHLAGDDAHSLWLGLELLYGSHPAHKY